MMEHHTSEYGGMSCKLLAYVHNRVYTQQMLTTFPVHTFVLGWVRVVHKISCVAAEP